MAMGYMGIKCTCNNVHMCVCMYAMYGWLNINIYVCSTCMYMYVRLYVLYMHMYVRTYMHVRTYEHTCWCGVWAEGDMGFGIDVLTMYVECGVRVWVLCVLVVSVFFFMTTPCAFVPYPFTDCNV